MQIKLKVIPDEGATEVYEFKDYGDLLEHIVNLPAPEDDHEEFIDHEGDAQTTVEVDCKCDEPPTLQAVTEDPQNAGFMNRLFKRKS